MLARVVTGLTLAPVVVWAVLYAPKPVMFTLLALAAARCADELVRMSPETRRLDRVLVAALAAVIALAPLLGPGYLWAAAGLSPVIVLSSALLRPEDVQTAARRAAQGLLALGYIGVLVAVLTGLFAHEAVPQTPPIELAGLAIGPYDTGRGALLSVLAIVFLGDTGAYFAGRSFGRNRLYPLISPKKTMEGALGGLAASILGALAARWLLLPTLSVPEAILLGAACGAIGQIGDLVESLFKRATNTKDSGQLLPGHGGLLDRVDGVLFAGPVLQAWLVLTCGG